MEPESRVFPTEREADFDHERAEAEVSAPSEPHASPTESEPNLERAGAERESSENSGSWEKESEPDYSRQSRQSRPADSYFEYFSPPRPDPILHTACQLSDICGRKFFQGWTYRGRRGNTFTMYSDLFLRNQHPHPPGINLVYGQLDHEREDPTGDIAWHLEPELTREERTALYPPLDIEAGNPLQSVKKASIAYTNAADDFAQSLEEVVREVSVTREKLRDLIKDAQTDETRLSAAMTCAAQASSSAMSELSETERDVLTHKVESVTEVYDSKVRQQETSKQLASLLQTTLSRLDEAVNALRTKRVDADDDAITGRVQEVQQSSPSSSSDMGQEALVGGMEAANISP